MFEIHPWFRWHIIARADDNGRLWYISHLHRGMIPSWTRDPLYARHFTLNAAEKLIEKFTAYLEAIK